MGDHVCLLPLCTCPVHESRLVNRARVSPEKLKEESSGVGGSGVEKSLVVWG